MSIWLNIDVMQQDNETEQQHRQQPDQGVIHKRVQ